MRTLRRLAAAVLAASALVACGSAGAQRAGAAPDPADWPAVQAAARGQTVDWYMYGGDEAVNAFVGGYLTERLERDGIRLRQVRITDTVEAVDKVLGEKRAGRDSGGAVDLVWVNGENFATGKQAGLWHCGYVRGLPNSRYVDFTAPAVTQDFGTPVDGCESPWQQANSALVYDSAALSPADVTSMPAFLDWVQSHPGRFTYPAPPDFTGSMVVRTFLYALTGGADALPAEFDEAAYEAATAPLWPRLEALEPSLWRGGDTYPTSQTDVERLYANGEVDAFFTYGPGAVGQRVSDGAFPGTTREAVLAEGNISNVSFVAIPYNSADKAAAMVVADALLDPAAQLALFETAGAYPVVDVSRTAASLQRRFAAVRTHPAVLPLRELSARAQPELSSDYVTRLERDWKRRVLQQ